MRALALIGIAVLFAGAASPQAAEPRPKFEAADVHTAPQTTVRFMRGGILHGERYEVKNASMLELISSAYGVDSDKVLGGPTWLEMDRFEVIAKAPAKTPRETLQLMLQSLLAERFKLAVRQESKPMPAYRLTVGKQLKLKEADGSGEPGCRMSLQGPPAAPDSPGPVSMTLTFSCHNTTVAAFAEQVRGFARSRPDSNPPVVDQTGLKGTWNIDFKFAFGGSGDAAQISEALDKQLGLKLEPATLPQTVIEVQSVNQKPAPNPPETAAAFPPLPEEFEVAAIKPSQPGTEGPMMLNGRAGVMVVARGGRGGRGPQIQNGRLNLQGYSLKTLIMLAWDLTNDMLVGAPKWLDTDRFDIVAKVPGGPAGDAFTDMDSVKPLLRSLLLDRFKLAVHTEPRPADQYVLLAAKPKLKKADPSGRSRWLEGPAADGKDPRTANPALTRLVTCQNMTMAQFASLLPNMAGGYLGAPAIDETGLEGAWDFTLAFSGAGMVNGGGRGGLRGGDAPGGDPVASDPGGGLSLFEAISKQLGLKLELQKRPMPALVIDRVEQTPTEN